MENHKEQLEHLSVIRKMMEESSRFISLSGLSGIFAGIFALLGAASVYWYGWKYYPNHSESLLFKQFNINTELLIIFFGVAILVLLLSIGFGIFFTTRNSIKKGIPIWGIATKRMLINLFLPLFTGGILVLLLIYHNENYLVAPAILIFYGLALINASHYTLSEIHYLGLCEIALGLIAAFFIGYGLLFWAIGFGLLHIIYGTFMYFKHEKK